MILATITFRFGGADRTATLKEHGWWGDGDAPAPIGALLDALASPGDFGPADGDPIACAAAKAAGLWPDGKVTYVRPAPPVPAGSVY